MSLLELTFASGESSLSVRRFAVHEAVSAPFAVSVWARSPDPSLDLGALVGKPAALRAVTGYAFAAMGGARRWAGICRFAEQIDAEHASVALSTYRLEIVPRLWLLTQRRGHRVFQNQSIPDLALALLKEWGITPELQIDWSKHPRLEHRVQYGESDYAFLARLLEEAGLAFTFADEEKAADSRLVIGDHLHAVAPRPTPPIPWVEHPNQSAEAEFVTRVRLAHEVRPGAHTIRDYDFRRPALPISGEAPKSGAPEDRYEQYEYRPGGFLVQTGTSGTSPVADDRGFARTDGDFGAERSERALLGERLGREGVAFETNAVDLHPGVIFAIGKHPHGELDPGRRLLALELSIEGAAGDTWHVAGRAVFAGVEYRPPIATPKPEVRGVQSATVVGPRGTEIHTDEFGRVRVQFPWDREGTSDENSSCWIRVSQGWGGAGYGMLVLPRLGQEVLVGFLGGDPDHPVVVGRLFNQTNPVPYKLPDNKTISTWKSDSSIGSNGFNELQIEDKKGDELVYQQAEKNQRTLVKHDETITVQNDRDKHVGVDERDTTGVNRTEVTGVDRTEITGVDRILAVGGNAHKRVKGDEIERTEGRRLLRVGKSVDAIVRRRKRERVEVDVHLVVARNRRERIDGDQSLSVGIDQHEHVIGSHALETGQDLHLASAEAMVGEAAHDVTLKGPGGFLRIDAAGVTIKGTIVKINAGGSPGRGAGSRPALPEEAREGEIAPPAAAETDVVVDKRAAKPRKPEPAKEKREDHRHTAEECELEELEITCEHQGEDLKGIKKLVPRTKREFVLKLPHKKDAKKPYDVIEVIAGHAGHGDTIKAKIVMARPRCATHKGQALLIRSADGHWVKAEDTSTFEVTTHGFDIEEDFLRCLWPWAAHPHDYTFTAPACSHGGLTATVRAYPNFEVEAWVKLALGPADKRVEQKMEKAREHGKVEKRGRPAQTDWLFEIRGKVAYSGKSKELSTKYEDKIRQLAGVNRLVKRGIDKFCEVFYTFTGVVITPVMPALSLYYFGKFKEVEKSWRVGAEWTLTLKADPLIGLTAKIEILDVMATALQKTQFAVIGTYLKKVRHWAEENGQEFSVYVSFTGLISGEAGAKKNALEPKAGPYGSIEGQLKVEFGAKASFGSKGIVAFSFGAEAKGFTGLSAKLTLDNDAKGLFLKGLFTLLLCRFEYAVWASGKVIWEIKESHGGEYTLWEDKDLLTSSDIYVLKNAS